MITIERTWHQGNEHIVDRAAGETIRLALVSFTTGYPLQGEDLDNAVTDLIFDGEALWSWYTYKRI